MSCNGLKMGSFHLFRHPKWSRIIFGKTDFGPILDPFFVPFLVPEICKAKNALTEQGPTTAYQLFALLSASRKWRGKGGGGHHASPQIRGRGLHRNQRPAGRTGCATAAPWPAVHCNSGGQGPFEPV